MSVADRSGGAFETGTYDLRACKAQAGHMQKSFGQGNTLISRVVFFFHVAGGSRTRAGFLVAHRMLTRAYSLCSSRDDSGLINDGGLTQDNFESA